MNKKNKAPESTKVEIDLLYLNVRSIRTADTRMIALN